MECHAGSRGFAMRKRAWAYLSLLLLGGVLLLILSPPSASADNVATTGGFTLELGPVNGVNVVGTQHQVTARLGAGGGVIAAAHVHFAVSGSNTMSGNATTNASGEATFSYAGANSGTDTITACFDANDDQQCEGDELAVNVTKRWITAGAGQAGVTLGLTPITAVNPVGTAHTVTATVNGGVQANQKIHFAVTGANATTGDATADVSGQASFTYTGAAAGTDTIVACIDGNGNKACDDDELAVSVVKRFVATSGGATGFTLELGPVN